MLCLHVAPRTKKHDGTPATVIHQFSLRPRKDLLIRFDQKCKGRARNKVIYRLMQAFADGRIELEW